MKRRLQIGALLCSLLSATALHATPPAGPSPTRINDALKLLRSCSLDPDRPVLDTGTLAGFGALQQLALHAESTDLLSHPQAGPVLRRLRASRREVTPGEVLAALCAEGTFNETRVLLEQLDPGTPVFAGELAWVPLIAHKREYPGLGLVFVFEQGEWQLQLGRSLKHEWVLVSPAFSTLHQRAVLAAPNYQDPMLPPACQAGPAPAPKRLDDSQLDALERLAVSATSTSLPGPRNALSVLQRRALTEFAEGVVVTPSPMAQAVHAEVLYRSTFFASGPAVDSPAWWAQLESAIQFARRAAAAGMPLTRFAPLLAHYARLQQSGSAARAPDLAKAAELFAWAARAGDETAARTLVQYQWEGLGGLVPDCTAALQTLEPLLKQNDMDLLTAAAIALDCPDPRQRQPALAITLFKRMEANRYQWFSPEQLQPYRLALACQGQPDGPGCARRASLLRAGETTSGLAWQRARWLADDVIDRSLLYLPRPGLSGAEIERPVWQRRCE